MTDIKEEKKDNLETQYDYSALVKQKPAWWVAVKMWLMFFWTLLPIVSLAAWYRRFVSNNPARQADYKTRFHSLLDFFLTFLYNTSFFVTLSAVLAFLVKSSTIINIRAQFEQSVLLNYGSVLVDLLAKANAIAIIVTVLIVIIAAYIFKYERNRSPKITVVTGFVIVLVPLYLSLGVILNYGLALTEFLQTLSDTPKLIITIVAAIITIPVLIAVIVYAHRHYKYYANSHTAAKLWGKALPQLSLHFPKDVQSSIAAIELKIDESRPYTQETVEEIIDEIIDEIIKQTNILTQNNPAPIERGELFIPYLADVLDASIKPLSNQTSEKNTIIIEKSVKICIYYAILEYLCVDHGPGKQNLQNLNNLDTEKLEHLLTKNPDLSALQKIIEKNLDVLLPRILNKTFTPDTLQDPNKLQNAILVVTSITNYLHEQGLLNLQESEWTARYDSLKKPGSNYTYFSNLLQVCKGHKDTERYLTNLTNAFLIQDHLKNTKLNYIKKYQLIHETLGTFIIQVSGESIDGKVHDKWKKIQANKLKHIVNKKQFLNAINLLLNDIDVKNTYITPLLNAIIQPSLPLITEIKDDVKLDNDNNDDDKVEEEPKGIKNDLKNTFDSTKNILNKKNCSHPFDSMSTNKNEIFNAKNRDNKKRRSSTGNNKGNNKKPLQNQNKQRSASADNTTTHTQL